MVCRFFSGLNFSERKDSSDWILKNKHLQLQRKHHQEIKNLSVQDLIIKSRIIFVGEALPLKMLVEMLENKIGLLDQKSNLTVDLFSVVYSADSVKVGHG